MQSLGIGGFSRAEVVKALHNTSRTVKFKYEHLDRFHNHLDWLSGVESGRISNNALAEIKRVANFRLRNYQGIDFLSDRIRPWFMLKMPSEYTEVETQLPSFDSYEEAILTDAPSGYWRLNELEGVVAHDVSGNNAHGEYLATRYKEEVLKDEPVAFWPLDEPPSVDAGLLLPGTGNYVATPNAAALNITGDLEIAVRCAADDWSRTGAPQTLVAKGYAGVYRLYLTTVGTIGIGLHLNTEGSMSYIVSTVPVPFADGEGGWLRATWDSATGICRFYTAPDSVVEPQTWTQLGADRLLPVGPGTLATNTVQLVIGGATALAEPFIGVMYRAIIRNGIDGPVVADWSAATHESPYHDGRRTWTVTGTGYEWVGTPQTTVAHDLSGNGHHGVYGPVALGVPSPLGVGVEMEGTIGVTVPGLPSPTPAITVEWWARYPSSMSGAGDFGRMGPSRIVYETSGFIVNKRADGNIGVRVDTAAQKNRTLMTTVPVTDDEWHHFVLVIDLPNEICRLYVDTVQAASRGLTDSTFPDLVSDLLLGHSYDAAQFDEFALYDHALTPERIRAHYNTMMQTLPTLGVSGPTGTAVQFEGGGFDIPHVELPLNVAGADKDFTWEGWVKLPLEEDEDYAHAQVAIITEVGPRGDYWGIFYNAEGDPSHSLHFRHSDGGASALQFGVEANIPRDEWFHLVLSAKFLGHTTVLTWIINGVESGQENLVLSQNEYPESSFLAALVREDTVSHKFSGSLAEITKYHYALSEEEALIHYQMGIGTYRPTEFVRIEQEQWVEWPLGIFLLNTPTQQVSASGNFRDIEAYDQLVIVRDHGVIGGRYSLVQGTKVISAVQALLDLTGIQFYNVVDSEEELPVTKEWNIGESYLKIINELLGSIGYRSLYFDSNGYAMIEPYTRPDARGTDYTYRADHTSVIKPNMNHTLDLFSIPNTWVAVVSEPDRPPLTSTYINSSSASPTSTVNRGRVITRLLENVDATSQTALDTYVQRIAVESSQVFESVEFETAIMPHHEDADLIEIDYSNLGSIARYVEHTWDMPLQAGALMKHRVRRVVII